MKISTDLRFLEERMALRSFLLIIIFWSFRLFVYSQNWNDLYENIDSKNKNTVDKALESIEEAGTLTQEANSYYNEALELQSNFELDEKALQKELSKTEKQAISLQLKADKLYSGAYKSLFEVCLKAIKNKEDASPTEYKKSADQMMSDASNKRKEASKTKNLYEKASILNDAAGLENAAIENMILAVLFHSGGSVSSFEQPQYDEYVPPVEDSYESYDESAILPQTTTIQSETEDLTVDQKIIEKYQDYVSDPSIPDPITIGPRGVTGVSSVSMDLARDAVQEYQTTEKNTTYQESYYADPEPQISMADVTTEPDQTATYQDPVMEPETETYSELIVTESLPTETYPDQISLQDKQSLDPAESGPGYDIGSVSQPKGVRFMVQVAASKIPLNKVQMGAIYSGSGTIEVVRENGWYKYRITGFRLFSDARTEADNSGVRHAWVLSADANGRINLIEARNKTSGAEEEVKREGRSALQNETDFYLQLAASRVRYSSAKMAAVCGQSGGVCREVIEEGWFKYQIFVGADYQEALNLRNKISGESFIVAYSRGKKMNLFKAIHGTK